MGHKRTQAEKFKLDWTEVTPGVFQAVLTRRHDQHKLFQCCHQHETELQAFRCALEMAEALRKLRDPKRPRWKP